jgi:hypothetical protein
LLGCAGLVLWLVSEWRGPTQDEFIRQTSAALETATSAEEAEATIADCGTVRLPSGEWVTGVGVNSHSSKRAKGTLVLRDSRGQVKSFVGHVCGPRWMPGYFPTNHRDFLNLDAFYAMLTVMNFQPYTPPK